MKMIIYISNMMNVMFMSSKQPMHMIIIILIQTLINTMFMSTTSASPWFNYLLMIIFIGGMMVVFIYITSITPNEKNEKFNYYTFTIMTFITTMITYKMKIDYKSNETIMKYPQLTENYQINLNMMFNKPVYLLSMAMMIYLFIALLVVNKISNLNQGPLRKKY